MYFLKKLAQKRTKKQAQSSVSNEQYIDFSQSKIAILVDVKDEFELVRFGMTIFGTFQDGKKDLNYKISALVH